MSKSASNFAEMLTTAVRKIKAVEGKNLDIIQDELGYALDREGQSYINYLRKGNVPGESAELEALARMLYCRRGLAEVEVERFLRVGGHAHWSAVAQVVLTPPHVNTDGGQPFIDFQPDGAFVAGPPIIKPRQFFGRERELRRIFTWLRQLPMSHTALVGPKRSGKTSLLHYVRRIHSAAPASLRPGQKQDWLPNAGVYRWVWVDFQDPRNRRLNHLLRLILTELDMPTPAPSTPCDLDAFMDIAALPHRWQRPTIIVMDDVDDGLSAPELQQTLWDCLKALASSVTEGNLSFIISAHEDPAQLADKHSKSSHFFNIFNTVALGSLTEVEARDLIVSGTKEMSEADVDWVLAQSHCWPLLVQILCQEWQMAREEGLTDESWKASGMQRISAYAYLLNMC